MIAEAITWPEAIVVISGFAFLVVIFWLMNRSG
jgi:hypothetical protein